MKNSACPDPVIALVEDAIAVGVGTSVLSG